MIPTRLRAPLALATAIVLSAPMAARAQEGVRVTPPYVAAAPFAEFSRSALALRDSVVARARAQLGKRYRHGGESPKHGFDCSGLVAFVLGGLSLEVPRTAAQQATTGIEVVKDTAQLLPGDLLTFGKGKKVTHIGIYVGNGLFVQASSKAGKVIETKLLRAPAPGIRPWQGVRRLVIADSLGPAASDQRPAGTTSE
jgi:cell wall-associated NlpC family hydrolase